VAGPLALAGVLVLRHYGLALTRPLALVMVSVSAVAGLATLALCWLSRFELARLSAALAVAAVVAGWAAAQAPRMLPGMTVTQAAAGRATLVALTIAVACGAVVLIPALALLYTLYLRGRLDTPEAEPHAPAPAVPGRPAPDQPAPVPPAPSSAGGTGTVAAAGRARVLGGIAIAGLIAGGVLLVFTDMAWSHAVGVACFLGCAVATFRLVGPD
jgi:cytochrome d ubiquinol oxidase subunit II